MQAMAEAVRTSTTNIAAALGGSPISIRLDPRPITPPAPAAVDFVDVDTAALEALVPVVVDRFESLRQGLTLERHASSRPPTGRATPSALVVEAVARVHRLRARPLRHGRRQSITSFVRSQLESVLAADR